MVKRKHFLYHYFWHKELAKSSDQSKLFLGMDSANSDPILLFWKSITALPLGFWRDRRGSFIMDSLVNSIILKLKAGTARNKLALVVYLSAQTPDLINMSRVSETGHY